MKQIYKFNDWTSASRMRNEFNSDLSIDVGVIRGTDKEIEGYQITVYNSVIDTTVYRFYVDYKPIDSHVWSLDTEGAIIALNLIGFPCTFIKDCTSISCNAREILISLSHLGFTHIYRSPKLTEIFVLMSPENKEKVISENDALAFNIIPLSQITDKNYSYHEFSSFVSQRIVPIDYYLNSVRKKDGGDR